MPVSIIGNSGIQFPDGSLQTAAASPFVLRNRIINGDMRIDQRNAGASVTPANGAYTLDRWGVNQFANASKFSVQQNAGSVTPPAGFTNYLGVTSLSAYSIGVGDIYALFQRIEGFNVADLGWGTANAQTVTLSFWVRSSLTGTFGGAFQNEAGDRAYPFTYTISAANTWEKETITVAGDTTGTWLKTNGSGLQITFGLGVGSNRSATAGSWQAGNFGSATGATSVVGTNGATWYLTGVQLEQNTSATPFERRLYNQELANCQRYFAAISPADLCGYSINTTQGIFAVYLPVPFRSTPTGITVTPANFSVVNGSNSLTTPSAITFDDAKTTMIGIVAVTTGLAAGQGCRIISATGALIQINGGEL